MGTGVRAQATFDGSVDCPIFTPNRLRPDMCTECYHKIFSHNASAVEDDEKIRQALEYTAAGEKTPSEVLKKGVICAGSGSLYLGGFKAVLNKSFMTTNGVAAVVNTAKGLEMFGPKYVDGVAAAKERGVDFLELNWLDAHEQVLPAADVQRSVKYIHAAITAGTSVVVHYAQGKSRSTTVVLAYICSILDERLTVAEGLAYVKERRAMAGPNSAFLKQLQDFEAAGLFVDLRRELTAK